MKAVGRLGSVRRALQHGLYRARAALLIAGAGTLGLHDTAAHVAPARIAPGSYVAFQANGRPLPWTTKVPAVEGLTHWARLDLAVLRISADGRYTLSYRYAQDVLDSSRPVRLSPARDEVSSGRYSESGKSLTFVPAKTGKDQRAPRPVTAEISGADISLDKMVFVGERPFRVRLLFRRDASFY
jgi:hypothetical protein